MSALTTDKTLFNANGVYDPEVFKTGVAIKRKINFELAKPTGSTNYEFLPLPPGFVLNGITVIETKKCSASSTITVKAKSDSATIGAEVNVGSSSTLAHTFMKAVAATTAKDAAGTGTVTVPGAEKILVNGEMLCLVAGASFTDGEIEVVAHGFLSNGEGVDSLALTVPYRTSGQTPGKNASKGDIYLRK